MIRALWTPGRGARVPGPHYALAGARPGPFPAHDVRIWVGSYKERMLRLTGELAAELGVAPTPDPGVRLSPEAPWDEAARPAGPAPDPAAGYDDAGRAFARDLVAARFGPALCTA